jgi:hypothetical protein
MAICVAKSIAVGKDNAGETTRALSSEMIRTVIFGLVPSWPGKVHGLVYSSVQQ